MHKKLLILGANGMLGSSIHRYFSQTQHATLGTVRSASSKNLISKLGFNNIVDGIDVLVEGSLENLIKEYQPDYVFNCIGLIKQLSTSQQPTLAIEINSLFPHKIAQLCSKYNSQLIHFSTDCVFSGKTGNYNEDSIPDAFDLYGRSKLLGEVAYDNHITFRTSIIGHELESNVSLINWFLNQSNPVKGFSNAVFSGLPTYYIAEFIDYYIINNSDFSGLYHLSAEPINKYRLLNLVKEIYDVKTDIIEYPDFVINRSLNSGKLKSTLSYTPPNWQDLIKKMHYEYNLYFKN
ncbi:dTDP-4-dehydrorhamnose reductase family protein [Psychrobacter lutiphocae]|uniref:dTDP-4-dehydrorhamnose reductase family protein n=1 Tax=Psychrobacter lutiphocae TaxID=540500 RepID=UPI000378DE98|nr:SDR family oxidoreductase [Psychrobacter lutiphocae]